MWSGTNFISKNKEASIHQFILENPLAVRHPKPGPDQAPLSQGTMGKIVSKFTSTAVYQEGTVLPQKLRRASEALSAAPEAERHVRKRRSSAPENAQTLSHATNQRPSASLPLCSLQGGRGGCEEAVRQRGREGGERYDRQG